jgi:selT/selW/selH-like putative selenoprotein
LRELVPGIDVELKRGSGGAFEVTVDDKLLFSKLNLDRFPAYQEIPTLIGL